jgi:GNAT superfamily N-acetyltransferase
MPLRPDPGRPDWRRLADADGAEVGTFLYVEREGRLVADLFEPAPGVPLSRVAEAILAELAGWRVAAGEPLGAALLEAGGQLFRHAHVYTHDLAVVPEPPPRAVPLRHDAAALVPAYLAAYGPDHPDAPSRADEDPEEELRKILEGGALGPLLDCSAAVLDGDRVVAAAIVTDVPGEPPFGGPWVSEVFRDPAHPGTGRAVLEYALARVGGPALSLAVTEGNPAIGLYERLGFRRVVTALSVDL